MEEKFPHVKNEILVGAMSDVMDNAVKQIKSYFQQE